MQHNLLIKGFGIVIIILFIGVNVLPSVNANIVNTNDYNKNNSKFSGFFLAGIIKNKVKVADNYYTFDCVFVLLLSFEEGKVLHYMIIKDGDSFILPYIHKFAIFTNHIIFGFFRLYP